MSDEAYYGISKPLDGDDGFVEESRKVQVHKVTVLVVDHDGLGANRIKVEFENTSYANHCMSPKVKAVESVTIDYTDAHSINQVAQCDDEYRWLFPPIRIASEDAAIVLSPEGEAHLVMPEGYVSDDTAPRYVMVIAAMYHYLRELDPGQRIDLVRNFIVGNKLVETPPTSALDHFTSQYSIMKERWYLVNNKGQFIYAGAIVDVAIGPQYFLTQAEAKRILDILREQEKNTDGD